ncbi:Uncharacterised protein [Mycobacteroides abscessus subsp. abscessus]|uniref:hypothetical protein n=1 Tax=Mycobacteroides abscessus TaxID=36809 RepID=UPI000927C454|nr:hypothetical protein [Mycobacteroides abscessus]MBE5513792.1 hypothetical protein [Mycobacteroides abscessus]MBN7327662.1 hypothetical protein [Mycobacteroides abscessus subsp. abscessus]SID61361.1 Uncharacterised protein [Mycobacteroides abscessus subsp. abscessus]SIE84322.1 Uncharacterised protein [Mycobacteroides abscessus subsp. abscessus]SIF71798.1 Uncharacterised protein [Mycobacteroides abscessus subsp. abscessus]
MTENLIEIETRWAERQLPRAERASVTISAWTNDEEIARRAAELESAYASRHELDTEFRLFRSFLRTAAMATAEAGDSLVLIRSVLDGGVDELISAATTDTELEVLVTAAEAGHGGSIPGLRRELELLRDAERDDTVESA